MSTWTHVTGSIRLDVHTCGSGIEDEKAKKKHKKMLDEMVEMIDWRLKDNNLPGHSEGELGVTVSLASEDMGLSQILITFHGDMRDFHQHDYPILKAYFERAFDREFYSRLIKDVYVSPRQGVLFIEGTDETKIGNTQVITKSIHERF